MKKGSEPQETGFVCSASRSCLTGKEKTVQLDIENLSVLIKHDTALRQTNISPVHCTDLNIYILVVKNRNVTTFSLNENIL